MKQYMGDYLFSCFPFISVLLPLKSIKHASLAIYSL